MKVAEVFFRCTHKKCKIEKKCFFFSGRGDMERVRTAACERKRYAEVAV